MRVLLVDDEPLALLGLRQLLAREADVEIVGECDDGRAAAAAVLRLDPDLVLLDVQMPGLDGFGVVAEVGAGRMPPVIFVTAHDEHALRAFEVSALDYLLKPLSEARFARALARARTAARSASDPAHVEQLAALLVQVRGNGPGGTATPTPYLERMVIRARGGRTVFISTSEVHWIEADDYYVQLHVGSSQTHLVRQSLHALEARLDPARWARLHRSALVNLDRLREVVSLGREDCEAVLHDGTRLPVSRRRLRALEERLGRLA